MAPTTICTQTQHLSHWIGECRYHSTALPGGILPDGPPAWTARLHTLLSADLTAGMVLYLQTFLAEFLLITCITA